MLLTHGKNVTSFAKRLQCKKRKSFIPVLCKPQYLPVAEQRTNTNSNTNSWCAMIKKNDHSGIASISFSNPTIFNGTLYQALSSLHEWKEGKGLILNSNSNFKNSQTINDSIMGGSVKEMLCKLQELVDCIQTLPLISIYLLNGKSSGVGTDLFLSTDFRIVTGNSEINFDHLQFGLPPLAGGMKLLKNLTGERECLKLFLRRAKLSGEEAVDVGLADKCLSNEDDVVDGVGFLRKRGWSTEEQVKSAENWLCDLLGSSNEDASIVQALKRILLSTRDGRGGIRSRKLDVSSREILSCLHDQPHLTAMGVVSEPMFAHLAHTHTTDPTLIMGGNAKDDFIA